MTPEQTIRTFFDAYSEGRPELFDELLSPDYVDYGHTPPGRGTKGARDDYERALEIAGGLILYDIDALVSRDDTVAAGWTGHLPNGSEYKGVSLYLLVGGRIAETRHALIGAAPTPS